MSGSYCSSYIFLAGKRHCVWGSSWKASNVADSSASASYFPFGAKKKSSLFIRLSEPNQLGSWWRRLSHVAFWWRRSIWRGSRPLSPSAFTANEAIAWNVKTHKYSKYCLMSIVLFALRMRPDWQLTYLLFWWFKTLIKSVFLIIELDRPQSEATRGN